MKRILATIRCDLILQARNGFYYAAAVIVMFDVFLLRNLPQEELAPLLTATLINNVIINTFYFIGALVLLEKNEGTLEAQIVTPVRPHEYLASKVVTLTLLSVAESILIVLLGTTSGAGFPALVAGVTLASIFFSLAGFVAVARHDSLNSYLLPSILVVLLLSLPLLPLFGIGRNAWLAWHPLQPSIQCLQVSFRAGERWDLPAAAAAGLAWLIPAAFMARAAFRRFIVGRAGGSR